MAANLIFLLLFAIVYLISSSAKPAKDKIYYVDLERINLTYWNPKYVGNPRVISRRVNRSDPLHYINIHAELLVTMGNNVMLDIYVFEFLSNEYRRSFVEAHFKLCDMMRHEVFGPIVSNFLPHRICPVPKGFYDIQSIHFPDLPILRTFPFQKGRIYTNSTITGSDGVRERLFTSYTDALIKQRRL